MKTLWLLGILGFCLVMLTTCGESECEQNCVDGYCDDDGKCNCWYGYTGEWCDEQVNNVGGGPSNNDCYVYTSAAACNQPNYCRVNAGWCCPSSRPYYCSVTHKCYTSCSAARVACGNTNVSYCD